MAKYKKKRPSSNKQHYVCKTREKKKTSESGTQGQNKPQTRVRIKESAVRVHTACAVWPYVTHLATCFSEQDAAAVCDDAKRRAAHLHLFSTRHTRTRTRTHARFMAFNGPALSLASRLCRKVRRFAAGRCALAQHFIIILIPHIIWSGFLSHVPFFQGEQMESVM